MKKETIVTRQTDRRTDTVTDTADTDTAATDTHITSHTRHTFAAAGELYPELLVDVFCQIEDVLALLALLALVGLREETATRQTEP